MQMKMVNASARSSPAMGLNVMHVSTANARENIAQAFDVRKYIISAEGEEKPEDSVPCPVQVLSPQDDCSDFKPQRRYPRMGTKTLCTKRQMNALEESLEEVTTESPDIPSDTADSQLEPDQVVPVIDVTKYFIQANRELYDIEEEKGEDPVLPNDDVLLPHDVSNTDHQSSGQEDPDDHENATQEVDETREEFGGLPMESSEKIPVIPRPLSTQKNAKRRWLAAFHSKKLKYSITSGKKREDAVHLMSFKPLASLAAMDERQRL